MYNNMYRMLRVFRLMLQTLIGHNEDGDPIDIVTSFMVHARIVDPDFGTTDEFLAFCYAGSLCGKAFGVNFIKKTVTSVNALFPQNVNTTFIGMQSVHARVFLQS